MGKKDSKKKDKKRTAHAEPSSPVQDGGEEYGKKAKRVNVDIAPGLNRLLKDRVRELNSSPEKLTRSFTQADVVNDALDKYFDSQVILTLGES